MKAVKLTKLLKLMKMIKLLKLIQLIILTKLFKLMKVVKLIKFLKLIKLMKLMNKNFHKNKLKVDFYWHKKCWVMTIRPRFWTNNFFFKIMIFVKQFISHGSQVQFASKLIQEGSILSRSEKNIVLVPIAPKLLASEYYPFLRYFFYLVF